MALIVISTLAANPTISKGSSDPISASQSGEISPNQKPTQSIFKAKVLAKKDDRAQILAKFLKGRGSPMASDAEKLVRIADKYGLDWKLLPAIAGVESQYGRMIPAGSYNPYGWNNGSAYFSDWASASEHVAAGIRTRYAPGGAVTPWRIGPSYAENPLWAYQVSKYMYQIDQS